MRSPAARGMLTLRETSRWSEGFMQCTGSSMNMQLNSSPSLASCMPEDTFVPQCSSTMMSTLSPTASLMALSLFRVVLKVSRSRIRLLEEVIDMTPFSSTCRGSTFTAS